MVEDKFYSGKKKNGIKNDLYFDVYVPISQLPQPCKKGDGIAIEIPEDEYIAGLEECNHNLHGRIIWPKGSHLLP